MGISYWAINNLLRRQNWAGDHFAFRILELLNSPSMILYIKANIILGKQVTQNICLGLSSFQTTISILKFIYSSQFCFLSRGSALKPLKVSGNTSSL